MNFRRKDKIKDYLNWENYWELKTLTNIEYFQSKILNEYNFNHAFFTKRCKGNEPIKLQIELGLNSTIHSLKNVLDDDFPFRVERNYA